MFLPKISLKKIFLPKISLKKIFSKKTHEKYFQKKLMKNIFKKILLPNIYPKKDGQYEYDVKIGELFTEVWSGDVRGDLVVIRSRMERGNLAISDDWWRDDECLNLGLNINLLSGPVRSVRVDKKVFASTVSIVRHHDITPRHRYTKLYHRRSCMHTIRAMESKSK